MEAEELKVFFQKLGDRLWKENNLSDVTWALCESYPIFKELFLQFFFKEITDATGIEEFEREYSKESCRPDFYFRYDNRDYIIEIKIYDRNDHFDQYKEEFKTPRFGWIANYQSKNQDNIEIRTWEELKKYLERNISSNNKIKIEDKLIIQSYCEYITNVCSIIKFKKMKLDELPSLFYFNKLIQRIIRKNTIIDIESNVWSRPSIDVDYSGWYFTIRKNSNQKESYPWFGISYKENSCISIDFEKKWCQTIYNGVKNDRLLDGKLYSKPNSDEAEIWFGLKQEYFDNLNKEEAVEKQEQILTDFFIEVMEKAKSYL